MTQPLLKKAELHVHIEGTVAPATYLKLAARHRAPVPEGFVSPEGTYVWSGFPEFLRAYDRVADMCRTPEDYHDITYDYLKSAAAQGSLYTEFFNSPEHATRMGLTYANLMEGMASGIAAARTDFGHRRKVAFHHSAQTVTLQYNIKRAKKMPYLLHRRPSFFCPFDIVQ